MRIDQLSLTSKSSRKRSGRGRAAGRGKTAGRGTKGQNARSGGGVRVGFEGGQSPLIQRIPKQRGFRAVRQPVTTVTTSQINQLKAKTVTNAELFAAKIIDSPSERVKIVLKDPVATAVKIEAHAISDGALKSLEAAGGAFTQSEISSTKTQSDTSK